MVIGDVLQNLRTSLDYLVWELVSANKEIPGKMSAFPICGTQKDFMNQLGRDCLLGVHPDAIAEIAKLQPYFNGADVSESWVWTLNEFTNINKHRRVVLTTTKTVPVPQGLSTTYDEKGNLRIQVSPPPPSVDTKFGPVPIVDGKVQMNPPFIACVAFNEGPPKGVRSSAVSESHSKVHF
jgi:hypothetical protein